MILIETARPDQAAFEHATLFAAQLNAAGFNAVLSAEAMPEIVHAGPKFEALPFLRDVSGQEIDHLIVIGADQPHEDKLSAIRILKLKATAKLVLMGRFESRQAEISAASRFAYVTNRDPIVHNLSQIEGAATPTGHAPCYGVAVEAHLRSFVPERHPITIYAPDLTEKPGLNALQMFGLSSKFEPVIITSGKSKAAWMESQMLTARIHAFNEMDPVTISRISNILVLTAATGSNERALMLVNNAILSGHVVIDASEDGKTALENPSVLRGPAEFAALAPYLQEIVLPNRSEIGNESKQSRYAIGLDLVSALRDVGLTDLPKTAQKSALKSKPKAPRTIFLPTNGVGLGHAQRCSLIADEMKSDAPHFLAFPSCLPMIQRRGFSGSALVQRSRHHLDGNANDLINFSRLSASLGPHDTLVFDGGYIFDSIYRTLLKRPGRSVWIRRGLWSAQQDNRIPLSRESAFSRVIIPMEAFDSLNQRYSDGAHIHEVGPIVQRLGDPALRKKTRAALAKKLGVSFDKLIVTMLGGGVAADRSAQIQSVCNTVEARKDTLNLIVVWPGAQVQPVWYSWQNSRVISTDHAGLLADAADMMISAVGYNSFHEVLYNAIPCAFMPQVASYMDDQTLRAETAEEMGLAALIDPAKPASIEREITRFLDGGKADTLRAALGKLDLPKPGAEEAARLIREVSQ